MEIKLTVKLIKGNEVLLKDENNQIVKWPLNMLPHNPKLTEVFYFNINKNRAKDILNEILNP